jgi:hypothetical protein
MGRHALTRDQAKVLVNAYASGKYPVMVLSLVFDVSRVVIWREVKAAGVPVRTPGRCRKWIRKDHMRQLEQAAAEAAPDPARRTWNGTSWQRF